MLFFIIAAFAIAMLITLFRVVYLVGHTKGTLDEYWREKK